VLEVHAVINPVAGRRNLAPAVRRIREGLRAAGVHLVCRITRDPGDATRFAAEVPDHARALLIAGGDGTVREVIDGVVGRVVPLLILPNGTENIVAKYFGMSGDPAAVVDRILSGVSRAVDIGVINGCRFLTCCGIGFDAEAVSRLHATRQGHITHFDYFWPLWRTFWAHPFPVFRVEVDGRLLFEGSGLAIAGVLPRYALGLRVLARARRDDGLLDVCVYPCASRAGLIRHSLRTLMQRHIRVGGALYAQCRTLRVSADAPVPVQMDGDIAGSLPARCSVIPAGCRFLL
jgi:diacylglycerol kinase (ATP)